MDEAPISLSKTLSASKVKGNKFCIIHYPSVNSSDIRPLTNASHLKIQEIQKQKDQASTSSTTSKFHQICDNIPTTIDFTKHGFHRECYKRFTNIGHIQPAQKRKVDTECGGPTSKKKRYPSGDTVLFSPEECIICGKETLWMTMKKKRVRDN